MAHLKRLPPGGGVDAHGALDDGEGAIDIGELNETLMPGEADTGDCTNAESSTPAGLPDIVALSNTDKRCLTLHGT